MNSLFEITEEDVARLDQYKLRSLINKLLQAEADRYGIPHNCIEITNNDNAGDGGVDARINHNVVVPPDCLIPQGLSVWQYKATNVTPKEIEETESKKPGVQDAIKKDGYYFFVVGRACSDTMRRNRTAALHIAFEVHKKLPKAKLITASDIARKLSDYPFLAADLLDLHVHDEFFTFNQWEDDLQEKLQITYQADDHRRKIIDEISNTTSAQSGSFGIRMFGADGIGKTRLVAEAILAANQGNHTCFAQNPEALPNTIFSLIRSRKTINKVILVVDQCTNEDFWNLWSKAKTCYGKIQLFTIERGLISESPTSDPDIFCFNLERLNGEFVRRIIGEVNPTLNYETEFYIEQVVNGDLRLAIAIAKALSTNNAITSFSKLVQSNNQIGSILSSLVGNDEDKQNALRVISLMSYMGIRNEVEDEAKIVANYLGVDFKKLKLIIHDLEQHGLVIQRGRYCYVSPRLLAIYFARDVWKSFGSDILLELFPALPTDDAQIRLLERLADLGDENYAQSFIIYLFGEQGEFGNIDALDQHNIARLFSTLVNVAPLICTDILTTIFENVPKERLLTFRVGRGTLRFTLEKLLRLPETFFAAARIILKLAEAENETFSNNSSGIWQEIFYTHVGASPFSPQERHILIEEIIDSSNSFEQRSLGVKAIEASLTHFQHGNVAGGPGGRIPQNWRPTTNRELYDAYSSALRLLDRVLADADERIRLQGISVLIAQTPHLAFFSSMKSELLTRIASIMQLSLSDDLARDLLNNLELLLDKLQEVFSEDERQMVSQWVSTLYGESYSARLKRWLGEFTWADQQRIFSDEEPFDINSVIENLAKEGYENLESLLAELEWLLAFRHIDNRPLRVFASRLSTLDVTWRLWPILKEKLPIGSQFTSDYLSEKYRQGEHESVNQIINDLAEAQESAALVILLTVVRMKGNKEHIDILLQLVERGWMPPEALVEISRSQWLPDLSATDFRMILNPLVKQDEPSLTFAALRLIKNWIDSTKHHDVETARFFISLLRRTPVEPSKTYQESAWTAWKNLAMFYLKSFPLEVIAEVLLLMKSHRYHSNARKPIFILREALKQSSKEIWPLVGDAILDATDEGIYWPPTVTTYSEPLDTGSLLEVVDVSILIEWLERYGLPGARVLAKYVRVYSTPMSELVRYLIIHFGDDEEVIRHLYPFGRGGVNVWSGNFSGLLKDILDIVETWEKDPDRRVRRWALTVSRQLRENLYKRKDKDEEEDLLI